MAQQDDLRLVTAQSPTAEKRPMTDPPSHIRWPLVSEINLALYSLLSPATQHSHAEVREAVAPLSRTLGLMWLPRLKFPSA